VSEAALTLHDDQSAAGRPGDDRSGEEAGTALREPLIAGGKSPGDVTDDVARPLSGRPTALWWLAFFFASGVMTTGVVTVAYQLATGIGTWGLNKTVGWAFDITNFVFWVGIGHAGTLISAVLFLLRQRWRTSVNRSAEAMTLFAVICAALFPLIHMGRPWLAFWVFPYPNVRGSLWVNFRSPLLWDVFAISTYFIISAVFWYVGLVPDLATLRDRLAKGARTRGRRLQQRLFAFFSLGWDGSLRTWSRYEKVYLLLAGLATPLVLSVHSIVSFDFATSVLPGWHTTIFPPYFVAGAIFSGMAMVLTLMLIARKTMRLEDYITLRHVDAMTKLILVTSGIVALAYGTELFVAAFSDNPYEQFAFANRLFGPMGWAYWIMVGCNVVAPQLFWSARLRRNLPLVFSVSILINVGMWFERFVIIVSSLHRDFLPSSWASYTPTSIELATLAGTFGLFFTAFLLFCRFLPVIAMAEVKGVLSHGRSPAGAGHRRRAPTGERAPADRPERWPRPAPWPVPEPATAAVAAPLDPSGKLEEVES
jgi:molybdopterin-containing oxidoreductase family membrane subunit